MAPPLGCCEEEDWPMLPVRGAREEEGWRGSSKSLRSAGGETG